MNAVGAGTAGHTVARAVWLHAGIPARPPRSVFGEWLVLRLAAERGGRGLELDSARYGGARVAPQFVDQSRTLRDPWLGYSPRQR